MVGKSGSGKTTLLKCIYGLEDLAGGQIFFKGEPVLGPAYHLVPGHPQMSLVSQEYHVLENHTIAENIYDKLPGFTTEEKEKRASRLLKLLELNLLRNTRAKHLSSGQKQRVAIARALAIIPELLLLDEPFSNLDKLLSEKLFSFVLKEVKKNSSSLILITHLAEEALKFADTICVVDEGKILQTGPKWEVYYRPGNTRLAGLLGGFNLVKKEDLLGASPHKKINKVLLRPDQFIQAPADKADMQVTVTQCTFNGKCFEILSQNKNGNQFLVYTHKPLAVDKSFYFKIRI